VTWTVADFKTRRPEFNPVDVAVVQGALDEAARECDPRLFGDRFDDAVSLLAAHKLSVSPFGQQARLESDDTKTTYWVEFERIVRQVGGGPWAMDQIP
jgi:hypothetical protein